MNNKIVSYKGFNKELKCRDFQFEIGKTFTHEDEQCHSGFHACPAPLDTFGHHSPADSRYCVVEQSGDMSKGDDKVASSVLTVKAEINIFDIVKAQIEWVKSKIIDEATASNTGNQSAASNTGYQSSASNTGTQSAASNTGDYSAASITGNRSAASNTGYRSASSNTGNQSSASNTGNRSAASVEGEQSVAVVTGCNSKAKASEGSWVVITERNDDYEIINIKTAKAGVDIEPDTYYKLVGGEFVKAGDDDA